MNIGKALFTSADGEHKEEVTGHVTKGQVPDWLSGSLIRNGPSLYEIGDTAYNHFFDGMAMLQKFSIKQGAVTYVSQFIRSDTYNANTAHNRIVVGEFGTAAFPDPCKSLLGRMAATFWPSEEDKLINSMETDNTLVNVFPVGDQLFAATETPKWNRIDPNSLDRLEQKDLRKLIAVNTITAHPHIDPDGTVYNLGSSFEKNAGPQYAIVRIPQGDLERAEIVAEIPARWRMHPAYYHSFAITENYFLFVESALAISVWRILLASKIGWSFDAALKWYDGYDSLIHVYNRRDGSHVKTCSTAAFFTFHHMNAYEEEGGVIVMDVSAYSTGKVITQVTLENLRKMERLPHTDTQLRRYRIDLNSEAPVGFEAALGGKVSLEFPQINYKLNGRRYRYGYGVGNCLPEAMPSSQILKFDWQTGSVLHWYEADCEPSEAIFVQRPGATDEDDGVLLSSVIRCTQPRSLFLLILNASDLSEVARVDFDGVSVPRDIHGAFFGDEILQKLTAAAAEAPAS